MGAHLKLEVALECAKRRRAAFKSLEKFARRAPRKPGAAAAATAPTATTADCRAKHRAANKRAAPPRELHVIVVLLLSTAPRRS